jgi:hypothetical protein
MTPGTFPWSFMISLITFVGLLTVMTNFAVTFPAQTTANRAKLAQPRQACQAEPLHQRKIYGCSSQRLLLDRRTSDV